MSKEGRQSDPGISIPALLKQLGSKELSSRLKAIEAISQLSKSSAEILRALENLMLNDPSKKVREAAARALSSSTHRALQRQMTHLAPNSLKTILREIERLQADGILSEEQIKLLRLRYDFSSPAEGSEQAARPETKAEAQPEIPGKPKRTLGEVLFSESAIRTALYLGAFFVIASSFLLYLAFESLRFPILALSTIGFLLAALGLRKRLPQGSFVLSFVFSFLLIADAALVRELLNVSPDWAAVYWIGISLLLAAIWGAGAWLYQSRLFSVTSFGAAIAAAALLGEQLDISLHLSLFFLAVVGLSGLGAVNWLKRWQNEQFARPLFWVTQLIFLATIFLSFATLALETLIDPLSPIGLWFLVAATWSIAAVFYYVSNRITSFRLFPYMASASLIPIAWFLANAFSPEIRTLLGVTWTWGVFFVAGSEIARSVAPKSLNLKAYTLPMLLGSSLLLVIASGASLLEQIGLGVTFLIGTALVYGALSIRINRWLVWFGALVSAYLAYAFAFELSFLEDFDFYVGFVFLWPALALLSAELFVRLRLKATTVWHQPLRILGVFAAVYSVLALFFGAGDESLKSGIGFLLFAAFFTLYAIFDSRPRLGYLATAALAISVDYLLAAFEIPWLLTGISTAILLYAAGFIQFRLNRNKDWFRVLRYSGLLMSLLVAMTAPLQDGPDPISAVGIAAALFTIEAFAMRKVWAAFPANLLFLGSYFLVLRELEVTELMAFAFGVFAYYLIGFLPILLGQDKLWSERMRSSGLVFATLLAFIAPAFDEPGAVVTVALAASAFAIEAYYRRNVWLGFPSNLLYLGAYFLALTQLEVSEPQFYSVGAALLGLIMHYLLLRSGFFSVAAITGTISQLILFSTTYIQLISNERFTYFLILFLQAMVVIAYGLIVRARSLIFWPIFFVVAAVVTVVLGRLRGLGTLILVGGTGLALMLFGIIALAQRERISEATKKLGERLGGWQG